MSVLRAYLNWADTVLSSRISQPVDVATIQQGKVICQLIDTLSPQANLVGNVKSSGLESAERYLQAALDHLLAHFILTSFTTQAIIDGDIKSVLDLLWLIILHYNVHDVEEGPHQRSMGAGKKKLLDWCQARIQGTQLDARNTLSYNLCFADRFQKLVESFCGMTVPSSPDMTKEARLTSLLQAVEDKFGIKKDILSVRSVLSGTVDDQILVAYIGLMKWKSSHGSVSEASAETAKSKNYRVLSMKASCDINTATSGQCRNLDKKDAVSPCTDLTSNDHAAESTYAQLVRNVASTHNTDSVTLTGGTSDQLTKAFLTSGRDQPECLEVEELLHTTISQSMDAHLTKLSSVQLPDNSDCKQENSTQKTPDDERNITSLLSRRGCDNIQNVEISCVTNTGPLQNSNLSDVDAKKHQSSGLGSCAHDIESVEQKSGLFSQPPSYSIRNHNSEYVHVCNSSRKTLGEFSDVCNDLPVDSCLSQSKVNNCDVFPFKENHYASQRWNTGASSEEWLKKTSDRDSESLFPINQVEKQQERDKTKIIEDRLDSADEVLSCTDPANKVMMGSRFSGSGSDQNHLIPGERTLKCCTIDDVFKEIGSLKKKINALEPSDTGMTSVSLTSSLSMAGDEKWHSSLDSLEKLNQTWSAESDTVKNKLYFKRGPGRSASPKFSSTLSKSTSLQSLSKTEHLPNVFSSSRKGSLDLSNEKKENKRELMVKGRSCDFSRRAEQKWAGEANLPGSKENDDIVLELFKFRKLLLCADGKDREEQTFEQQTLFDRICRMLRRLRYENSWLRTMVECKNGSSQQLDGNLLLARAKTAKLEAEIGRNLELETQVNFSALIHENEMLKEKFKAGKEEIAGLREELSQLQQYKLKVEGTVNDLQNCVIGTHKDRKMLLEELSLLRQQIKDLQSNKTILSRNDSSEEFPSSCAPLCSLESVKNRHRSSIVHHKPVTSSPSINVPVLSGIPPLAISPVLSSKEDMTEKKHHSYGAYTPDISKDPHLHDGAQFYFRGNQFEKHSQHCSSDPASCVRLNDWLDFSRQDLPDSSVYTTPRKAIRNVEDNDDTTPDYSWFRNQKKCLVRADFSKDGHHVRKELPASPPSGLVNSLLQSKNRLYRSEEDLSHLSDSDRALRPTRLKGLRHYHSDMDLSRRSNQLSDSHLGSHRTNSVTFNLSNPIRSHSPKSPMILKGILKKSKFDGGNMLPLYGRDILTKESENLLYDHGDSQGKSFLPSGSSSKSLREASGESLQHKCFSVEKSSSQKMHLEEYQLYGLSPKQSKLIKDVNNASDSADFNKRKFVAVPAPFHGIDAEQNERKPHFWRSPHQIWDGFTLKGMQPLDHSDRKQDKENVASPDAQPLFGTFKPHFEHYYKGGWNADGDLLQSNTSATISEETKPSSSEQLLFSGRYFDRTLQQVSNPLQLHPDEKKDLFSPDEMAFLVPSPDNGVTVVRNLKKLFESGDLSSEGSDSSFAVKASSKSFSNKASPLQLTDEQRKYADMLIDKYTRRQVGKSLVRV